MIIVRINGGLGNQMFQYACGLALAQRVGVDLKLDISEYAHYKLRRFGLNNFAITASPANAEEVASYKGKSGAFFAKVGRKIGDIFGVQQHGRYYQEREFSFDPRVMHLGEDVYLDGYWQSEKYFAQIREVLLREFTIKTPAVGENAAMLDKIAATNAIAVHVRRGDYVQDQKTNTFHGTVAPEYYRAATDHILRQYPHSTVFVFSDDPAWAKKNLRFPVPAVYVDHNAADKDFEDMRLMSACHHQIIANSSFSWWAAWLNVNPQKIVVAPRRWFAHDKMNTADLIPATWLRM